MNEETPASGNRWEPSGAEPEQSEPTPVQVPADMPVVVERRPWRDRVKPAVAGAIAGTAIVTGIGGFVVGRATSDSEPAGVDQQQQQVGFFPGDGDGDRDGDGGFPGGGPGDMGGQGGPGGGFPGQGSDQQAEPGSTT